MASIRKTKTGKWQVTVRLPDGKRHSATHSTKHQARQWGYITELVARRLAAAAQGATLAWSPAGLDIHIPEDLITMDAARHLEEVLHRLFPAEA